MGFSQRRILLTALFVLSILFALATLGEMRPLEGEPWLKLLIDQVLPRGGNSTPSPNPCTNIPGQGSGTCN
ncbi:Transmembrane protein [Parasponia andersonii]|uniref:Transmembrane protein n=1 Tax=Parasponia andersonii TaxID=3476 RepID=A0A2P5CGM2_PARAD|nr:Transmembrane protein [Parasponia andersonii]